MTTVSVGGAAENQEEEEEHQKEGGGGGGAQISGQQLARAQHGLAGRQPDRPRVQHGDVQGVQAHGAGGLPQPQAAVHVLSQ